jgi:hypothetical protein
MHIYFLFLSFYDNILMKKKTLKEFNLIKFWIIVLSCILEQDVELTEENQRRKGWPRLIGGREFPACDWSRHCIEQDDGVRLEGGNSLLAIGQDD